MYLGTSKKTNGCYKPQFASKPRKSWVYWSELTQVETELYQELRKLIKKASEAGNLEDQLKSYAEVNKCKERIQNLDSKAISYCVKENLLNLF